MSTRRRKSGLLAALAAALFCLIAALAPTAQATFPGRPGMVVFSLVFLPSSGIGEATGGLHAIQPGQPQLRQLTTNPTDYDPSFAPSGKKLVFRHLDPDDSLSGIYTLDLSSGQTTRITSEGSDTSPAFGRAGMIAFSRFSGGSYHVFLRTADGRMRRLTSGVGTDKDPVFRPDGKRIIFSRVHRHFSASDQPRIESERIFSISTDGSDLHLIGKVRGADNLDVSPDGRDLAFTAVSRRSEQVPGLGFGVWAKRLDGGAPRLVAEPGWRPVFSPSGGKIAYANYEGLWVRRADGIGNPTHLLQTEYQPMQSGGTLLVDPAWQPLP